MTRVERALKQPGKHESLQPHLPPDSEYLAVRPVGLILLLLASLGYLYNNIAVTWVYGFPITIPLILFMIAATIAAFSPGDLVPPVFPIILLSVLSLIWELLRSLFLGTFGEIEWLRSALQLFVAIGCFTFTSHLRTDQRSLKMMASTLALIVTVFGVLGILQVVLLNTRGAHIVVPPAMAVSSWDPVQDTYRTQGIQRAAVLSSEPGFYSTSLAITFVVLMFFNNLGLYKNTRLLFLVAIASNLGGLAASLAPSGWFILGPSVIAAIIVGNIRGGLRILMILSLAVIIFVVYTDDNLYVVRSRLNDIFNGEDQSLQARLDSPMILLWRPADSFVDFMIGKGIGVDSNYEDLISGAYWRQNYSTIINNTFAYVRVTQGWTGILLYLSMLAAIFRFKNIKWSRYLPLIVCIIVANFVISSYLSNYVWSLLALMAVLRRVDTDSVMSNSFQTSAIYVESDGS